jgi:DNA polymerase-3 subunit delta
MPTSAVKPVYVLSGSDEFLRDHHRKQIIAQAIGESEPQTCVNFFDSTVELAAVLDELRTLPFLAPHRVVVVSEADAFVAAHREGLEKYLESPSSHGTLVLQAASWPANTRLYKLVAKVGETIDCSVPEKQDLGKWIAQAAGKRGKQIAPGAGEMLVQWIGRNFAALDSEIEKLSIYAISRPGITEQDVAELVTASAGPGAFDLTNYITAGNAAGALRALSGMFTKRGEEFKTIGLIAWHLRRVLAAKQLVQSGVAPEKATPFMPYEQRNAFAKMLRTRSRGKLLNDFRRLIKADLAMKSGADALAALQELVVGLCS